MTAAALARCDAAIDQLTANNYCTCLRVFQKWSVQLRNTVAHSEADKSHKRSL